MPLSHLTSSSSRSVTHKAGRAQNNGRSTDQTISGQESIGGHFPSLQPSLLAPHRWGRFILPGSGNCKKLLLVDLSIFRPVSNFGLHLDHIQLLPFPFYRPTPRRLIIRVPNFPLSSAVRQQCSVCIRSKGPTHFQLLLFTAIILFFHIRMTYSAHRWTPHTASRCLFSSWCTCIGTSPALRCQRLWSSTPCTCTVILVLLVGFTSWCWL